MTDEWTILTEDERMKWADKAVQAFPDDSETACRSRLSAVLNALPCCRKLYQLRGYPEEKFQAVLLDLQSWVERHEREYGYPGLSARLASWAVFFLKGYLVQVHRLQVEFPVVWNMDLPDIRKGDPAVRFHIPAWGGALTQEVCMESFREIVRFFDTFHPDYRWKALCVNSWLLDPVYAKLLPGGNMARFQEFGHAYPIGVDETQESIWRVFGRGGMDSVPDPNRLQKALKEYLLSGGKIQEYGFYLTQEELRAGNFFPEKKKRNIG